MEGFSTQQHSYCHPHEPLLAGFPACSNLEAAAAMAYECSTSSPPLSMVMQQLQGRFPPSFGAEAAGGGGDNGRRMASIEASVGSAQEMMISRKNKRSNANVAGVKGERAGRGLGGVGDVDDAKVEEEAAGYVHVRARRGQATDRHSIAERLRRERIGEKMKMLQSLVPGCDKLTGKVLLDEIINYVQSLQSQVEFLSMRLATLNPTMVYELGLDIGSVCHPDAPQTEKLKLGSPKTPDEGPSKKRRAANVGHFQPDVGSDQFLRIVFKPTFNRLWIPHDFVRWFGEIPANIIVTTNTGCYWRMAMVREGDDAYIDQGWAAFAVAHQLQIGQFLVFKKVSTFQYNVDEDISTTLLPPSLQDEYDAVVKLKSNEVRIGPMTRARAKLLKQQVNLFLCDTLIDENFILPKSYYLCMIRYEEEPSIARGGEGQLDVKLDMELDMKTSHGHERGAGGMRERRRCSSGRRQARSTGRAAGPPGPMPGPTGFHAESVLSKPDFPLVPARH
ncbi:hypothetical protein QYE76_009340 [Lolium multiflorum]|uniref:BHLH domain-containing protein n=1 Tax=Lolium multiflorum TaxID=4521 RepID=A0AAD8X0U9_LOLMU|nr:hypothetical protein QYE76_009340 [Lolium multiflorum]